MAIEKSSMWFEADEHQRLNIPAQPLKLEIPVLITVTS